MKMTEHFDSTMDSSDDEAPEEVNFEDSKASALQSRKDALEAVKREQELLKEKRRKRHELFTEQKKRRRLPDDILEEIGTIKLKIPKQSKQPDVSEEEDDEGSEETAKKTKINVKKRSVNAARVKDETSSSQRQDAIDFIQSRLYGGPGSRRTTSNELLSLENKRGRNKGAAAQFVKKEWKAQKKRDKAVEKAEKAKQRWIQKQVA